MNTGTHLPITFAPLSELSSWTPLIATNAVATGAKVKRTSGEATAQHSAPESGGPLRLVPARHRTFGEALSLQA